METIKIQFYAALGFAQLYPIPAAIIAGVGLIVGGVLF